VYKVLLGKYEEKRPLAKSRHRLEDNIKRDFKETICKDVELIHLAKDTVQQQALVKHRIHKKWKSMD
jgi:hypothetical protein